MRKWRGSYEQKRGALFKRKMGTNENGKEALKGKVVFVEVKGEPIKLY